MGRLVSHLVCVRGCSVLVDEEKIEVSFFFSAHPLPSSPAWCRTALTKKRRCLVYFCNWKGMGVNVVWVDRDESEGGGAQRGNFDTALVRQAMDRVGETLS
jgi:hypothetical protein